MMPPVTRQGYDFVVTNIGFIVERSPDRDWKISKLKHADYSVLAYALSGSAQYCFAGKEWDVRKGDMLFFPKGFVHSAVSDADDPWSFMSIRFDTMNMGADNDSFSGLPNVVSGMNPVLMTARFNELLHCWTGKQAGYMIKCRSLLMDILHESIRHIHYSDQRIQHAQKIESIMVILQTHLEHSYSVDELADLAGLSASHFRMVFKKVAGMSVIQYHNQLKIGKARDLLLSGACNVTEAADQTGFNDIFYFSRLFKKITGHNPSELIRQ